MIPHLFILEGKLLVRGQHYGWWLSPTEHPGCPTPRRGLLPLLVGTFCVGRGWSGELFVEETGMFEVDLVGTAHHFLAEVQRESSWKVPSLLMAPALENSLRPSIKFCSRWLSLAKHFCSGGLSL